MRTAPARTHRRDRLPDPSQLTRGRSIRVPRRRPLLVAAVAIGTLAAVLALIPASAGHAAGGGAVVDHQNPAAWTGDGGVPDPAHDPNGPCRQELGCVETPLQVAVDPGYWTNLAGALQVRLHTNDLADFDLRLG